MKNVRTAADKLLNGFTLKTHYIPGTELGDDRRVRVLLPRYYNEEQDNYPVVYMLDGQNLFYDEESFAGISWRVSETLHQYPDLPGMIIVGIDNSHDRLNEYSPWPMEPVGYSSEYEGIGGGGVAHAEYIMETVKPFIDKTYRTISDKNHTVVAGSSLGGTMTAYVGIKYKDQVGGLGVFSLANQLFRRNFQGFLAAHEVDTEQKVYIQVGTDEIESSEHTEEEQQLARQDYVNCTLDYYHDLLLKGIRIENTDLNVFVGETHNEKYWAKHLSDCLRFLTQEW